MSKEPDIRTLYQNKFLLPSALDKHEHTPQHLRALSHRARIISHRPFQTQKPMLKYVKLVKNEIQPTVRKTESKYSITKRKTSQSQRKRVSQSMQLPNNNTEFIRQVMRVSSQEMGQLQSSAGGENKLLDMFRTFFQRRNELKQRKRESIKTNNLIPLSYTERKQGPRTKFYRSVEKRRQENAAQVTLVEKDIEPWDIKDNDFSV